MNEFPDNKYIALSSALNTKNEIVMDETKQMTALIRIKKMFPVPTNLNVTSKLVQELLLCIVNLLLNLLNLVPEIHYFKFSPSSK
jgi:hypothetical protein